MPQIIMIIIWHNINIIVIVSQLTNIIYWIISDKI